MASRITSIVLVMAIASTQGQFLLPGQQGFQTGPQGFQNGPQGLPVQPGSQQGPTGQQGPAGQQGPTGHRTDVCFPGEGQFAFTKPDKAFIPKVKEFSFSLFRLLAQHSGKKSAIMSPYSIWSVLTLAYFGSLGETEREIASALSFPNKSHTLANWMSLRFNLENESGSAELAIANRAYFSNRLQLNECLQEKTFDLERVDFAQTEAARQRINDDVSKATQGYIRDLIKFLSPETRMVLVNAIFFKGTWAAQFNPQLTRPQEFLAPPGVSTGNVMMMTRTQDTIFGEAQGLDAKMVELPYLNSNISMYLLLPNNPNEPISSLVGRLNAASFDRAVRSLPQATFPLTLSLPKFKLTTRYETEIMTALSALGVKSLFDPSSAELGGFAVTSPPLAVDTTIHQATVEVNEEGTVAAAATAFLDTRGGAPRPLEIIFNRPFVFMLVEKAHQLPLFFAQVSSAADLEEVK